MELVPYIFIGAVIYGVIHAAALLVNFKRKNKFCPYCHTKMETKIEWKRVDRVGINGALFKKGYSGQIIRFCPNCSCKIKMGDKCESDD